MEPLRNINSYDSLRILGIEDGSFKAFTRKGNTLLCCAYLQGNSVYDIRLTWVAIDGLDSTEQILKILDKNKCDIIILGGISFAGFNIIDAKKIFDETRIPIIVYTGIKPDMNSMKRALLLNFDDWKIRWNIIKNLGKIHITKSMNGWPLIYFEAIGIKPKYAKKILRYSADLCRIPEPVRVASIIAKALT